MFNKILIANRGDNGHKAAAAKPDCLSRAAQSGGHASMEISHV
jgi:hypothetical protein